MNSIILAATLVGAVLSGFETPRSSSANYVRFTLADATFDGISEFDTLDFDMGTGRVSVGHGGLLLDPCDESWKCIDIGFFSFAVPMDCANTQRTGRWVYGKNTFEVISTLNPKEADSNKIRYAISIKSSDKKPEGMAIYSYKNGVEAFALFDKSPPVRGLVDYHLVSDIGLFSGVCKFHSAVPGQESLKQSL